jgi:hypothetical protein
MKRLIVLLLSAVALFSCEKKDDATPVAVLLRSGEIVQYSTSGTKIRFEITAYSVNSKLRKFSITSFDSEYGEKTYIDSTINEEKFNYTFIFDVPEFSRDSVPIALKIRAEDFENNFYELNCQVIVVGGAQVLPTLTGIVIYSGSSGQRNAFSLQDPSQPFVRALADSVNIDIYDFPNETEPETLSREWRTNTDVRFVKANSFNFAMATAVNINASFRSAVRQMSVDDLKPNDIILVGRNDNAVGVILITDVVDNNGMDNDFYRFDIKLIP